MSRPKGASGGLPNRGRGRRIGKVAYCRRWRLAFEAGPEGLDQPPSYRPSCTCQAATFEIGAKATGHKIPAREKRGRLRDEPAPQSASYDALIALYCGPEAASL